MLKLLPVLKYLSFESVVCRSLRREDKFWLALHQYMRESSISTPPLIPLYVVTIEVRHVA
jgi:hypothetical protein